MSGRHYSVVAIIIAVAIAVAGFAGCGGQTTVTTTTTTAGTSIPLGQQSERTLEQAGCPAETGKVPPKYELELAPSAQCVEALTPQQLEGAEVAPPRGVVGLSPLTTTSYANGRFPCSALRPVTGGVTGGGWPCAGMLAPNAAAALNALAVYAHQRTGQWIGDNGSLSAYRSYDGQVYLFNNCPSVCATPGYSNHGWGLAYDSNTFTQGVIRQWGAQFGWGIGYGSCSDAPYEQWHGKYCGGYSGPDPGPYGNGSSGGFHVLKRGAHGDRVKKLQTHLFYLHDPHTSNGYLVKWAFRTGFYGVHTAFAVHKLQHDGNLTADGVYGPKTAQYQQNRWGHYCKANPKRKVCR